MADENRKTKATTEARRGRGVNKTTRVKKWLEGDG